MKSRTSTAPKSARRRDQRASGILAGEDVARSETLENTDVKARQDAGGTFSHIPGATYRLQFNAAFTLDHARKIVDYLHALGVTDVYASPLFQAGPQSTHGYDTCSHSRIGECLGSDRAFEKFSAAMKERGMGLLLDIVPNHMAAKENNPWWWDVLKHGERSRYARFFDIDWRRGGGKVVLPVLEAELDEVLAARKLLLSNEGDEPTLRYHDQRFPLIETVSKGSLPEVLERQHYRLVHWRRGTSEINYRRFFDVNELVSLRMEDPDVFTETHRFVLELLRSGEVQGLRIDHPDGLRDPADYFARLQSSAGNATAPRYIVAEKILVGREELRDEWPIAGTTGYEFLNNVNGLFIASANEVAITNAYREFTGCEKDFAEVAHDSKRRVLEKFFCADVEALARRLTPAAAFEPLRAAIVELIACFPVYRTYIRENTREVSEADAEVLRRVFKSARTRAPSLEQEFHLLEDVLFLRRQHVPGLSTDELNEFVLRFQQLTGPAAAKGVEDTAFYRFNRLISLNEVGGNPAQLGVSIDEFHNHNRAYAQHWPHSLLATATHDTKRGEDARARVNVLSELPDEWRAAVRRGQESNLQHKTPLNGRPAPDANDEFLFYQTLLGVWPEEWSEGRALRVSDPMNGDSSLHSFQERIAEYMIKAIKEAKRHTSWTTPNEAYEIATRQFVERVLDPANREWLRDFTVFERKTAFFGAFNSLSQTLLKLTSPGVPDFYQGCELWDLSLVDPDNRRPVNYDLRRDLLADVERRCAAEPLASVASHLLTHPASGAVKLFVIWRALQFRNAHRALFDFGDYLPLSVNGNAREHICAFVRQHRNETAIAVAPRLVCTLLRGEEHLPVGNAWARTEIRLPDDLSEAEFRNVFTDETISARNGSLRVDEIFRSFPLALLRLV